nr:hypothetical protein [Endozoicomonas acroporae]
MESRGDYDLMHKMTTELLDLIRSE